MTEKTARIDPVKISGETYEEGLRILNAAIRRAFREERITQAYEQWAAQRKAKK